MAGRKKVCFVSDENICRSIIAEVYLRSAAREYFEVQSFGLTADRIHYVVAQVLKRRGKNPNYSFSKVYDVVSNQKFDILVLMHPELKEKMPKIPYEYKPIIWNFEKIDLHGMEETRALSAVEQLCDQIEEKVKEFIQTNK